MEIFLPLLGECFSEVSFHTDPVKLVVYFSGKGNPVGVVKMLDHALLLCRDGFQVRGTRQQKTTNLYSLR